MPAVSVSRRNNAASRIPVKNRKKKKVALGRTVAEDVEAAEVAMVEVMPAEDLAARQVKARVTSREEVNALAREETVAIGSRSSLRRSQRLPEMIGQKAQRNSASPATAVRRRKAVKVPKRTLLASEAAGLVNLVVEDAIVARRKTALTMPVKDLAAPEARRSLKTAAKNGVAADPSLSLAVVATAALRVRSSLLRTSRRSESSLSS